LDNRDVLGKLLCKAWNACRISLIIQMLSAEILFRADACFTDYTGFKMVEELPDNYYEK
jgi:hypothetical protein